MKAQTKALLASIVVIALALTAVSGVTYSWFSDTETKEIGVSTAIVDYDSKFTVERIKGAGSIDSSGETITLSDLAGAQMYTVLIEMENRSTIDTIYLVSVAYGGTGLVDYDLQNIKINSTDLKTSSTVVLGDWTKVSVGENPTASFTISTTDGYGSVDVPPDWSNSTSRSFSLTVTVEVYQGDKNDSLITAIQDKVNDGIKNATKGENYNVVVPNGQTITLDNGIAHEGDKSRDVTFIGDGTQTVDVITKATSAEGGMLNYQRGSTFTFKNLTIQAGEGNFDGIVCDELIFENCTIKGKLTLYGKATFTNCTFDNTMANQYSIWTWGGTGVTFDNCTFNTNGKAILLYGQATETKPTNLTVKGCTFNDRTNGAAGKAAIEIGNDYNATYTLTIDNITVNGFADGKNTGSKLWANKNSMDAVHLSVTIDGVKIW